MDRDRAIDKLHDACATRRVRLAAFLLLGGFRAAGAQVVPAAPPRLVPLTIAVEDAADVWSRPDGTGYANDIVRAAFLAGGVEPHLLVVPYARCKAMVQESAVPACFSMSRDASIPAWVVFSDSANYTFSSDVYQSVRRPLRSTSREPLPRGSLVGVVRGYEYPDTLYRLERLGIVRLVNATSEATNLRKLVDGRIDAVVINLDATKQEADLLDRAGVRGRVSVAFRSGTLPAYVGFSMQHPQGADALARFNAGRRAIAANGVLRSIRRRWTDSILVAPRLPLPTPVPSRPPR